MKPDLEEIGASQRATAKMLGMSHTQIGRDTAAAGTNVPRKPKDESGDAEASGTNVPPPPPSRSTTLDAWNELER